MLTIDWASNLYNNELAAPSDISIVSLCAYFRLNIGDLNNILGTCFKLNNTQGSTTYLELVDGNGNLIDNDAAAIYKFLYLLSYYSRQIRNNLGVGGVSQMLSIQSDGGVVRTVDRTQISKVYLQLRKDTEATLKGLVNKYKMGHQTAQQVEGDDIIVSITSYPDYGEAVGVPYMQDII